jgi:predicted transport protein
VRREVLALDPCVTEEFLKYYVVYQAETNFVDVVAQASALRLSLNVSSSRARMPYVIGLVRQSLERQLGNGDSG